MSAISELHAHAMLSTQTPTTALPCSWLYVFVISDDDELTMGACVFVLEVGDSPTSTASPHVFLFCRCFNVLDVLT
jgi:hypothetical protein